jgi:hypothetical protein
MPLVDRMVGAPAISPTLFPALPFAIAYASVAVVLLAAKTFTVSDRSAARE